MGISGPRLRRDDAVEPRRDTNRHESMCCRERSRKASHDGVRHPDVFVEFLPAQRAALNAEAGLLQKLLRSIRQKRVA